MIILICREHHPLVESIVSLNQCQDLVLQLNDRFVVLQSIRLLILRSLILHLPLINLFGLVIDNILQIFDPNLQVTQVDTLF